MAAAESYCDCISTFQFCFSCIEVRVIHTIPQMYLGQFKFHFCISFCNQSLFCLLRNRYSDHISTTLCIHFYSYRCACRFFPFPSQSDHRSYFNPISPMILHSKMTLRHYDETYHAVQPSIKSKIGFLRIHSSIVRIIDSDHQFIFRRCKFLCNIYTKP